MGNYRRYVKVSPWWKRGVEGRGWRKSDIKCDISETLYPYTCRLITCNSSLWPQVSSHLLYTPLVWIPLFHSELGRTLHLQGHGGVVSHQNNWGKNGSLTQKNESCFVCTDVTINFVLQFGKVIWGESVWSVKPYSQLTFRGHNFCKPTGDIRKFHRWAHRDRRVTRSDRTGVIFKKWKTGHPWGSLQRPYRKPEQVPVDSPVESSNTPLRSCHHPWSV